MTYNYRLISIRQLKEHFKILPLINIADWKFNHFKQVEILFRSVLYKVRGTRRIWDIYDLSCTYTLPDIDES